MAVPAVLALVAGDCSPWAGRALTSAVAAVGAREAGQPTAVRDRRRAAAKRIRQRVRRRVVAHLSPQPMARVCPLAALVLEEGVLSGAARRGASPLVEHRRVRLHRPPRWLARL